MGGAFQISRCIFENPIWQDVAKFRIFFFIVGNAVFAPEGVRVGNILIKRGQYLRSYRNLQDDLEYLEKRSVKKYSLSVIERKVKQLVKEERLIIEDTEYGTLFTVLNYASYQGLSNYKSNYENGKRTAEEHQKNGNGTPKERQENNNKKDKKVNNIYTPEFEQFWSQYPRKVDKKKAFKSFQTAIKNHSLDSILHGTKKYSLSVQKTEKQYIKHAATFLNNESFIDGFEEEKPKESRPQLKEFNPENIFGEE